MKRQKQRSKKWLIMGAALVVLVAAGTSYYLWSRRNDTQKSQTKSTDSGRVKDGQVIEKDDTDNSTGTPTNGKDTTPGNVEDTSSKPITPYIQSAQQIDGSTIRVAAAFSSTANGSCRITLSKPGETDITQDVNIIVVPNGYACNGWSVTAPSSGGWTAKVVHLYNSKESDSVTQKVE
jgi:hypothetical protein